MSSTISFKIAEIAQLSLSAKRNNVPTIQQLVRDIRDIVDFNSIKNINLEMELTAYTEQDTSLFDFTKFHQSLQVDMAILLPHFMVSKKTTIKKKPLSEVAMILNARLNKQSADPTLHKYELKQLSQYEANFANFPKEKQEIIINKKFTKAHAIRDVFDSFEIDNNFQTGILLANIDGIYGEYKPLLLEKQFILPFHSYYELKEEIISLIPVSTISHKHNAIESLMKLRIDVNKIQKAEVLKLFRQAGVTDLEEQKLYIQKMLSDADLILELRRATDLDAFYSYCEDKLEAKQLAKANRHISANMSYTTEHVVDNEPSSTSSSCKPTSSTIDLELETALPMANVSFALGKHQSSIAFWKDTTISIDPGATFSIISSTAVTKLFPKIKPFKCNKTILLADRITTCQATSVLKVWMKLNKTVSQQEFFIFEGDADQCLLGLDYLKHCTVSYADNEIVLADKSTIKIFFNYLRTVDSCSVAPYTTKMIHVHNPCSVGTKLDLLVEPIYGALNDVVFVNKCIVDTKGDACYVPFTNLTAEVINVPKGHVAAKFTLADFNKTSNDTQDTSDPIWNEILNKLLDAQTGPISRLEKKLLRKLLNKYNRLFARSETDIGQMKVDPIDIQLTDGSKPIKNQPYRCNPQMRVEIEQQIVKLKLANLIEPADSPWAAPVVMVTKPDGSWRFCVDFRKVNNLTIKDSYPLPRTDDTLASLAGATIFTSLDLISGYHQLPLSKEAQRIATFTSHIGTFSYKSLPFGLVNAPAAFQRAMDSILGKYKYIFLLVYLDDIIIYSRNMEEHLKHLEVVFSCLAKAGAKLKPKKVKLCKPSIDFLGHIVSKDGIQVDPEKTAAIKAFPNPTTVTEIRRFIGMIGYYRKFIDNFTKMAEPLLKLTHKNVRFTWGTTQQRAMEDLKRAITSAPVLVHPNFTKPFVISADYSKLATGAVLEQDGKPVAFYSKKNATYQRNYTATQGELLAVNNAVDKFRPYILGRTDTVVRTDHRPLVTLTMKQHDNTRINRHLLNLQQYSLNFEYTKGTEMNVPDCLSRIEPDLQSNDVPDEGDNDDTDVITMFTTTVTSSYILIDAPIIKKCEQHFTELQQIVFTDNIKDSNRYERFLTSIRKHSVIKDKQIWFNYKDRKRLLIPKQCQVQVIRKALLSGTYHTCAEVEKALTNECIFYNMRHLTRSLFHNKAINKKMMRPDLVKRTCNNASTETICVNQLTTTSFPDVLELLPSIVSDQKDDPIITKVLQANGNNNNNNNDSDNNNEIYMNSKLKRFVNHYNKLPKTNVNGVHMVKEKHTWKVLLPQQLALSVIKDEHQSNHRSATTVLRKLRKMFVCFDLAALCSYCIDSCHICLSVNDTEKINAGMKLTREAMQVFSSMAVDSIGPLQESTSGNKYIILFICKFSRFVVAVPVPNLRALTVAIAFVEKILLTYRPPTVLTSDFGTEYKNSLVKSIATVAKIKHIFSPPYHHESNGSAERANRTIKNDLLKIIMEERTNIQEWDQFLHAAVYLYNNTVNMATGVAPMTVVFGWCYNKYINAHEKLNRIIDGNDTNNGDSLIASVPINNQPKNDTNEMPSLSNDVFPNNNNSHDNLVDDNNVITETVAPGVKTTNSGKEGEHENGVTNNTFNGTHQNNNDELNFFGSDRMDVIANVDEEENNDGKIAHTNAKTINLSERVHPNAHDGIHSGTSYNLTTNVKGDVRKNGNKKKELENTNESNIGRNLETSISSKLVSDHNGIHSEHFCTSNKNVSKQVRMDNDILTSNGDINKSNTTDKESTSKTLVKHPDYVATHNNMRKLPITSKQQNIPAHDVSGNNDKVLKEVSNGDKPNYANIPIHSNKVDTTLDEPNCYSTAKRFVQGDKSEADTCETGKINDDMNNTSDTNSAFSIQDSSNTDLKAYVNNLGKQLQENYQQAAITSANVKKSNLARLNNQAYIPVVETGDFVYIYNSNSNKFTKNKYLGPFMVFAIKNNYLLQLMGSNGKLIKNLVHINRVKILQANKLNIPNTIPSAHTDCKDDFPTDKIDAPPFANDDVKKQLKLENNQILIDGQLYNVLEDAERTDWEMIVAKEISLSGRSNKYLIKIKDKSAVVKVHTKQLSDRKMVTAFEKLQRAIRRKRRT